MDGQAVRLCFHHAGQSDTDIWVRTDDLPDALLQMEDAAARAEVTRASRLTGSPAGNLPVVSARQIARVTVHTSIEGPPYFTIAFRSGVQIHVAMDAQTVATLM